MLITGASRGIGNATAKIFAENKYNVIINYLNSDFQAKELEQEIKDMGVEAIAYKADVTKLNKVKDMIDDCMLKFGSIDAVVNNAGVSQQKLFTEISETEWDNMFAVHVKGAYNVCKCILPYMIGKKQGKIINVSSIWGITGASCEVHYSAAKAALIGFTKALAKEVGPSNIQVNCVAPGVVDTDMNAELNEEDLKALMEQTPLMRIGKPEEIAYAIYYLASSQADFITGQVLSPNGGFVI